ncbi:LexA family transcriptional regulator [Emticicia sp. BO119]|uniref:XRE family transcriptional regulator n=1 Tax=Emticicia sp. BO119 TaxID=2757768 RepID=UPI0015F079A7|nr:LexA family transcriptional regulator [Emticicia sp. BO119]MBA4852517.1 LexA family transcriptional regulator [Emticicia sp. BO119]
MKNSTTKTLLAFNIAHLRKLKELSQGALAEALSVPRTTLGSWEEGKSSPTIEGLTAIAKFFEVSIDTLVTVDLTQVTDLKSLLEIGGKRVLFPIMVDKQGNDMIELVPVKASAGYLTGYNNTEFIQALPRISLPYIANGKYRGFPIIGDSMPPLEKGAFVIGKYLENLSEIKDGKTYVILTQNDGLVYKRILKFNMKDRHLMLHSDNTYYMPYKLPFEEIFEIWEFVCSINPTDKQPTDLLFSVLQSVQSIQHDVQTIKSNMKL